LRGYYESDKNGFLEETTSLRRLHTSAYLKLFLGVVSSFGVLYGCLEGFVVATYAFVYASISRHLTQLYSSFGATLKDQVF